MLLRTCKSEILFSYRYFTPREPLEFCPGEELGARVNGYSFGTFFFLVCLYTLGKTASSDRNRAKVGSRTSG